MCIQRLRECVAPHDYLVKNGIAIDREIGAQIPPVNLGQWDALERTVRLGDADGYTRKSTRKIKSERSRSTKVRKACRRWPTRLHQRARHDSPQPGSFA